MCHHIDTAIDWDAVVPEEHADELETARTDSPETTEELDAETADRLDRDAEADPLAASPADD